MSRPRPRTKTAVMSLRVDPRVKAVAEFAAEREHRSLTSFIEVLILNHCETLGIHPPPPSTKEIATS
jgi:predicted HicB family RNase H-like nuclease